MLNHLHCQWAGSSCKFLYKIGQSDKLLKSLVVGTLWAVEKLGFGDELGNIITAKEEETLNSPSVLGLRLAIIDRQKILTQKQTTNSLPNQWLTR